MTSLGVIVFFYASLGKSINLHYIKDSKKDKPLIVVASYLISVLL